MAKIPVNRYILRRIEMIGKEVETYNVGAENQTRVETIAEIVTQEMKLKIVKLIHTGGVDVGGGWKGNIKTCS